MIRGTELAVETELDICNNAYIVRLSLKVPRHAAELGKLDPVVAALSLLTDHRALPEHREKAALFLLRRHTEPDAEDEKLPTPLRRVNLDP